MLQNKKIISILFFLVLSFLIQSWIALPGPTFRENGFQISGDGFNDQKISLGIVAHEFENNYYAKGSYNYFQEYQNLTVRLSGANNYSKTSAITGINIDFNNFTNPGIYTLDSAVSVSLFFKKDIPAAEYDLHYIMDSDGIITINTYEPIGGLIEGTFSGTFVKMKYNQESNSFDETDETVKITNGKFSVVHQPDYHWDAPRSTGNEPGGFKDKKKKNGKS